MEEVSRRSSVGVVSQRLTRALRKRAMLKQRKEEQGRRRPSIGAISMMQPARERNDACETV